VKRIILQVKFLAKNVEILERMSQNVNASKDILKILIKNVKNVTILVKGVKIIQSVVFAQGKIILK
jgi:hypothetical protein